MVHVLDLELVWEFFSHPPQETISSFHLICSLIAHMAKYEALLLIVDQG
jgi:hypothetical protein